MAPWHHNASAGSVSFFVQKFGVTVIVKCCKVGKTEIPDFGNKVCVGNNRNVVKGIGCVAVLVPGTHLLDEAVLGKPVLRVENGDRIANAIVIHENDFVGECVEDEPLDVAGLIQTHDIDGFDAVCVVYDGSWESWSDRQVIVMCKNGAANEKCVQVAFNVLLVLVAEEAIYLTDVNHLKGSYELGDSF